MAAHRRDIPRHFYTLDEYFALERTGDARYEYWDGEIVCMSGGSQQHAKICGNAYFTVRQQMSGRCDVFNGELAIKTPSLPPYRYPDLSVACEKGLFEKVQGMDVLTNPTVIIEVLSPTTDAVDRHEKRRAYQALPTLKEYLLIAQDAPHITHFLLEGGRWTRSDYADLKAAVVLPSIECLLRLSDVYLGVEFD